MQAPANLPPPLRTNPDNAFAHQTVAQRLSGIIGNVADHFPVDIGSQSSIQTRLRDFQQAVVENAIIRLFDPPAPDYDDWLHYMAEHDGSTWLDADWYYAEALLYRTIIQLTRWWEYRYDPFTYAKTAEIESDALWRLLNNALSINEDQLSQLLDLSLWGNRLDLSYAVSAELGIDGISDDLRLVDERPAILAHLTTLTAGDTVHLVTDNYGSETAMDLVLIHELLQRYPVRVMIHVKYHPTYVSDTTAPDIHNFIAVLQHRPELTIAQFGRQLNAWLQAERICLAPDLFWNSPLFFWQMPPRIANLLKAGHTVFIKGDANYRRIVGDAMWSVDTTFAHVSDYFPCAVVALRTLKSDPLVGVDIEQADELEKHDERWRVNGKRGVIQFHKPL